MTGSQGGGLRESVETGGVSTDLAGGKGELRNQAGLPGGAVRIGSVGTDITRVGTLRGTGDGPQVDKHILDPGTPKPSPRPPLPPGPEPDIEVAVTAQQSAKAIVKPGFVMPEALVSKKIAGQVQARVTIKADGSHTVSLSKTCGNSELDEAVLDYLRTWKWEAAKQDGKGIETARLIKITVNQK